MKQYISPEVLIVTLNAESRFALSISEGETGATNMESNHRILTQDWDDFDVED